mmetsp:Transcript_30275/g.97606  ORF Transcript_30275/g.97606 Transcript_30275/m.97606 type:complete len:86 (+) Transcript_30275:683-940(+)
MGRACKDDGRILLLEHGRSHYTWLNNILDANAQRHLTKWGCSWNRDILKVIDDAGLHVDYLARWHFGTTYYVVARPSSVVVKGER